MTGAFTDAVNNLDFTDRHREMLGIPIKAGPFYHFSVGDY
jgi:hypothetical protein